MNAQRLTFDVVSSIVVIGTDPEMADYDNPRGHLHGLSFAVRASNEHGDTWEHPVITGPVAHQGEMEAQAQKLADALQVRQDRLGRLPIGFSQWRAGRAVYGSAAWQSYGEDDELALERREAEEEAWA